MEITEALRSSGLTHKDKLVHLAAAHYETIDREELARLLGLSIQSVTGSLSKVPGAEPQTDREAVVDAIIVACNMDRPSMRDKDWRHLVKVASELDEAGATPKEIHVRARNLRRRFGMAPTPGALDKYWPQLAQRQAFTPAQVLGG